MSALLQDFRKFLDEEKIPYTEAELMENNDWLRSNIKARFSSMPLDRKKD